MVRAKKSANNKMANASVYISTILDPPLNIRRFLQVWSDLVPS